METCTSVHYTLIRAVRPLSVGLMIVPGVAYTLPRYTTLQLKAKPRAGESGADQVLT